MSYTLSLADLAVSDTLDLAALVSDPAVAAKVASMVPEFLVGQPEPTVAAQHWRNVILHAIVDVAYPASTFDYSTFAATVRAAETA